MTTEYISTETDASTTREDHSAKTLTLTLVLIGVLLLIVVLVAGALLYIYFSQFNNTWGNQEVFGQFGDYLGGVLNPVLGFATVLLLVVSLVLQMKELSLTRAELKAATSEAEQSRKAMQEQVNHFKDEAYLNELTRTMGDLRARYTNIINTKIDRPEYILDELIERVRSYKIVDEPTIFNLLYADTQLSFQTLEKSREKIKYDFENDRWDKRDTKWTELEDILIQFSKVIIKYYEKSNVKELTSSYLLEAKGMLKPFYNVFKTKDVNDQLIKINLLLDNAR